ncbi:EF-hand [Rhizodiscina lignyota]|uniref:EF-hand n=1 Tax=Rhizodiscina lignyota TaxID=1504668 RepID=A0A9P4II06_9PEZI|nr:EF-hand [Rhizodiscina lignyota]
MAYNKRYNPDALPAHAEPDQAAQLLAGGAPSQPPPRTSSRQDSSSYRPNPSSQSSSYNKPQPPRPDDRYGRHSPSGTYDTGRPAPQGSYSDAGRPPPASNYDAGRPPAPGSYNDGSSRQYSSRYSIGSPPPQNYGYGQLGPPPAKDYTSRPPAQAPPPTPAPPKDASDKDALWPLFRAVDKDQSGQLSEKELKAALVNGDWSSFDPHTVKMMIRMFDTDRSGTINFDEFCGLWGFLAAWRTLFDRFDLDRSGNISYNEFSDALVAFGYRLSPSFITLLFRTYDRRGENAMSFDLFVQACISLKRMTDVFKKYDDDRDGYITLSFEEFLTGAQSLFLMNSISSSTDTGLY